MRAAVLALILAACVATNAAPGPVRLTLAPGESRALPASDAKIGLQRIVSDSRCPVDVTCIWAGEVTAELWIEEEGNRVPFQLSSLKNPELQVRGFTVRIVEVAPPPRASTSIAPADYRLTVEVTPAVK